MVTENELTTDRQRTVETTQHSSLAFIKAIDENGVSIPIERG